MGQEKTEPWITSLHCALYTIFTKFSAFFGSSTTYGTMPRNKHSWIVLNYNFYYSSRYGMPFKQKDMQEWNLTVYLHFARLATTDILEKKHAPNMSIKISVQNKEVFPISH